MKILLIIALLPILFFLFGCSHSKEFETRLIALEQSFKNVNNKRDLETNKINLALGEIRKEQSNIKMETEKINLALTEIKKEQSNIRLKAEENQRRTSKLETLIAAERTQAKQIEGAITWVKGTTAYISIGKNDGVMLADVFSVYKDRDSKEKIASIKINAVDLASSSGEIEEKAQDVNVGYVVKIAK